MIGWLHQASCVAIGGRALMIEGPVGSGKSSLALALIDRGAQLIGDDGLLLRVDNGKLLARAAPPIEGLIEVRNVGLVNMQAAGEAPVALVIALDKAAPRFVETADTMELGGVSLPRIMLWPDSPILALRAELALARHGLA